MKKIALSTASAVLALGMMVAGASAANAAAPQTPGIQATVAGPVKTAPSCKGAKAQVEWVVWPIVYWEWARQSNGKYTGILHTYYAGTAGWTTGSPIKNVPCS